MPGHLSIVDLTASDPPTPVKSAATATVPINVLLYDAIDSASEERIRHVLQTICEKSPEASKIAEDLLLLSAEKVKAEVVEKDYNSEDPGESEEDEDDGQDEGSGSSMKEEDDAPENSSVTRQGVQVSTGQTLKRLRPRYAECENCNEEFDVEKNGRESCIWHPGDSEVNEDAKCWDDYEIWREGCPMDERFDDMPEGFVFSCCGRVGTNQGCKIGTHVEGSSSCKRARY